VNILFVNYGSFTTNSLNHIGGFAHWLCTQGHACVVAVPDEKESVKVVPDPLFIPATFDEVLARPNLFPDGRPADLIHAWTPREVVRHFVFAYQRLTPARLVVHLEDNEEYLTATYTGRPFADLCQLDDIALEKILPAALSHPLHHRHFLRLADAATVIVDRLRRFVPAHVPVTVLSPGVDTALYHPQPPDTALRAELGLRADERVIVYTGSVTFANEAEMRDLYLAVRLLNERGTPTRLLRTGFTRPEFAASFGFDPATFVVELGFVEKARLPRLLALADVLVQPGRAGDFNDYRLPSKLPEFLSMGRPVVLPAANLGAELADGREALVLQTGTPEEIAAACDRVFADPGLAAILGRNAAAFARVRFDPVANSGRLAGLYASLAAAPVSTGWQSLTATSAGEFSLVARTIAGLVATHPAEAAAAARDLAVGVRRLEDVLGRHFEEERHLLAAEHDQHKLTRQHAANLQAIVDNLENRVKLTDQHVGNITHELADARGRLARTETKLAHSDKLLASSRQQLTALDADHAAALGRIAELAEQLRLTQQHAENLTRELADARARLARTEAKLAISDKLLTAAREQLATLDADHAVALARLAELDDLLRLTKQHAGNLDELRAALQRRIGELHDQCLHLERTIFARDALIAERDRAIAQRDAKVRTMQRSFSWQATAPLRWLRRKLLDPWRQGPRNVTAPAEAVAVTPPPPPTAAPPTVTAPVAPPAALLPPLAPASPAAPGRATNVAPPVNFVYSVDQPQSWSLPPRQAVVRGWCFADDGRKLTGVRAVLPGRTVAGTYGFKRLDVLAAVRQKPQAEFCGWRVDLPFAVDDKLLDLEVADEAGQWHRFFHTGLRIGEGLGQLDLTNYEKWLEVFDRHTPERRREQTDHAARLPRQPLVSVVVPVYNTPEKWLVRAVESVRNQTYPRWELCLADDASSQPHVRPLLEQFAAAEPRIKVTFRPQNGHISAASNSALALATGDYVALLDHDDELHPAALYEVAVALNARPDADYLYTDEDKIDEDGRRFEPYFKPDWLPDLFSGQNYTSHLSTYRTILVREVGGFRRGFEGSQDWDLALRVIERTTSARIVHIPKVLYHWRAIPGSTAMELAEKNYPVEAARRALSEHFSRLGETVDLVPVPGDHWRVRRPVPAPAPLVSLVIPTRNHLKFLRRCVDSILDKTTYPNFEVLIVDNGSDDPDALAYLATLEGGTHPLLRPHHTARVLRYAAPFNFSAINNFAVRQAAGEIVGLLNNDLEVITPDWLDEMASQAVRPAIGCVGAMLYYPNDTIQHAGCVLGLGGVAGHAFRDFPRGTEGKFNRARLVQNYTAVTAACLLVRKAVYEAVGGLDERDLSVAFNDIDFCLKVHAAGYRNLWTPFAEFYHYESASRGSDDTPEKAERFRLEVETMLRRWGPAFQRDPAYNPNLTLEHTDFSLASPPRPATWA
jgi:glycosyltransferase involved in cell wall biosynthesis/phage shock protein A